MTRSEVQAILGPPSMAVLRGDWLLICEFSKMASKFGSTIGSAKSTNSANHFDKNDRVTTMHWNSSLDSRNAWENARSVAMDRESLVSPAFSDQSERAMRRSGKWLSL